MASTQERRIQNSDVSAALTSFASRFTVSFSLAVSFSLPFLALASLGPKVKFRYSRREALHLDSEVIGSLHPSYLGREFAGVKAIMSGPAVAEMFRVLRPARGYCGILLPSPSAGAAAPFLIDPFRQDSQHSMLENLRQPKRHAELPPDPPSHLNGDQRMPPRIPKVRIAIREGAA